MRIIFVICFVVSVCYTSFSQSNMQGKKLNKKEVERVINDFNGRLDESILASIPYEPFGNEEFYRLSDNRILFKLDEGNGVLYNSLQDILEIYSTDWIATIPKVNEKFLTQIPALVRSLSDTLKLNLTMTDQLIDLSKVDSAIRARGGITSINVEEHLIPLVAYCGQIMVNETNGIWEVRRENESEPRLFVKGFDGKLYDPYNPVLAEIIDASDDFSFAVVVEHLIKPLFKLNAVGGRDH